MIAVVSLVRHGRGGHAAPVFLAAVSVVGDQHEAEFLSRFAAATESTPATAGAPAATAAFASTVSAKLSTQLVAKRVSLSFVQSSAKLPSAVDGIRILIKYRLIAQKQRKLFTEGDLIVERGL